MLAAFEHSGGYAADGQISGRAWLRWQARITHAAAGQAAAWTRRLAAHPAVHAALAAGTISVSYARHICDWTGQLAAGHQGGADQILLDAAAGGAGLPDLAGLAEEIRRRTARPDPDDDNDGFARRWLRLTRHYRGHARLDGDLTPAAAAALTAVLDALGRKTGPEDDRTRAQRDHDALEETCRQLITGGLPDRAGQPTQIQLTMTLHDLLGLPGTSQALATWDAAGPPAPPGADCDAAITPIVTGHLNPDALAQPTTPGRRTPAPATPGQPGPSDTQPGTGQPGGATARAGRAAAQLAIARATAVLSGPGGLASWLRTSQLPAPANTISLPLDIGTSTDTIPPWLRRAVIRRDQHCRFAGCTTPPAGCHVHHLIPRSQGGTTSLDNCWLFCTFHHLVVIHRWGWTITINPDGTTTATSPGGDKILHSHTPAAA